MEDNLDNDMMEDLLVPEVEMNIDEAPIELDEEEIEGSDKLIPPEDHNGEVIDLDGDGIVSNNASDEVNHFLSDANQENENPAQVPEVYTVEEMAVYQQIFGPGQQAVQFLRLHCTACNEHLGSSANNQCMRFIHPLLKVLICKKCYDFYGSGDFDKDEDGSELYCRWCGQGGKVLCCAQCPYVFCQKCIRHNLGKKTLDIVKQSDDWTCFACKPMQIINVRVTSRALYDFVQAEIRNAAEMKEPEILNVDHSMCCQNKPPKTAAPKRKRSNSGENSLNPDNDDTYRKKKKIKMSILSHMSAVAGENRTPKAYSAPAAPRVWESQIEDEVVCTPDLSLLMDDDEPSLQTPTASPQPSCSAPEFTHPVSTPSKPASKYSKGKDADIQYIGQTKVVTKVTPGKRVAPYGNSSANSATNLGYKLPGLPVVLNTSTNKPITTNSIPKKVAPTTVQLPNAKAGSKTTQPVISIAHNRINSVIDATPARLAPGLRYEWFEKAAQVTARVNQNLSTRLCSLSKEQSTVSSLEGLASIHNNLQEILSNSINSLMQIRKNLRSDFIAGLKKLKFSKGQESNNAQPQQNSDDNDVIIVDSNTPATPTSLNNRPRGYIKVKPASELLDSSIITIPDDVVAPEINLCNESATPAETNAIIPATNEEEKEKTTSNDTTVNEEIVQDDEPPEPPAVVDEEQPVTFEDTEALSEIEMSEVLNPETVTLIRRAVQESKFESIVNDNSKLNVASIAPNLIKDMLSVRVIVESNFGNATPRTRPRKGYKAMNISTIDEEDVEQMLSSSVVVNTSKRKAFDDSFSAFVANITQKSQESSSDTCVTNGNDADKLDDSKADKSDDSVNRSNESLDKADDLDSVEAVNHQTENDKATPDPQTIDSGIDVDGEQSLSNSGVMNCQDN